VEKGERVDVLLLFKTKYDVERVFFCGDLRFLKDGGVIFSFFFIHVISPISNRTGVETA